MLLEPTPNPADDGYPYNPEAAAWLANYYSQSFGGGGGGGGSNNYLGADWDRYMNAVHNGFKGTMQDYEEGMYRDTRTLENGTTLVIRIKIKPDHLKYLGSQVQCIVLVFGKEFSEYNFVQSIFDTNTRLGRIPSYTWVIDGRDPNGFYNDRFDNVYFSDPKFLQLGLHHDGFFEDHPNDLNGFKAEWTLCGSRNKTWVNLVSFSWGYNIINGEIIPNFNESNISNSDHINNLQKVLYYYNSNR